MATLSQIAKLMGVINEFAPLTHLKANYVIKIHLVLKKGEARVK